MTIYIGHERCSRHIFGCPAGGRTLGVSRARSGTAVRTTVAKPSLFGCAERGSPASRSGLSGPAAVEAHSGDKCGLSHAKA